VLVLVEGIDAAGVAEVGEAVAVVVGAVVAGGRHQGSSHVAAVDGPSPTSIVVFEVSLVAARALEVEEEVPRERTCGRVRRRRRVRIQ
jgi:hypothetical protein